MDKTPLIDIKNISKQYKGATFLSLDKVNLQIRTGEVYGLLGPNGAGKTTLISILCGLIKPTSGEVLISGNSFKTHAKEIQKSIGVVPQEYALYPKLTAKENLFYFGSMFGLTKSELKPIIISHLDQLGLLPFADKKIKTFSGGMKRRVNLIAGILHNPKLLFLDEPTVGVDVQSKQAITAKLRELNKSGTTIIYTSHHLREAQDLCSLVGIIDSGKIIAEDTPSKLIADTKEARNLEDVFIELTGRELRDYA
ncbi:ABC-2 type transport system ATP-binding protein [Aquimarina amphilecti]|uniref:ABC-2 type transport system ATP-binding protein n=1 Tax=Aquimarina amphilecti TaxID=1038014 RepID=A0A1H7FMX2_AQUAM|nr:ABC transporter ATP-binding protein [Aquimarina amphilecti]SEK27339.1 ABC-2 type transport system ATP-binding protein [Aquimarina amphilecti]